MQTDAAAPAGETAQLFSRRYRSYVIVLLFLIFTFNFLDRQVIVILAEPIKDEFQLKDWQLGVITGLAFALLYSVLSIPVAQMADRGNRVTVITVSLTIWSVFTMCCGLAQNFVQLAVSRLLVGVGEAGGSPPAHSLITDITPRKNWAKAIAFYSLGVPVGGLLGMVLGGLLSDGYGWRMAFVMAGAPGLALALLAILTLREPRKLLKKPPAAAPPLKEALRYLSRKRSFVILNICGGLVTFVSYGQGAFYPSFFKRLHGDELAILAAQVNAALHINLGPIGFLGLFLGLASAIGGIAGTLAGGWLTDWAARRDLGAFTLIQSAAAFVRVPLLVLMLIAPRVEVAMSLHMIGLFVGGLLGAPGYTGIQALAPARMRATASAIFHLMLNAVGLGLGPMCLGLMSDAFATRAGLGPAEGLRWALLASCLVLLTAAVLFLVATPWFRREAHLDGAVQDLEPAEVEEIEGALSGGVAKA